MSMGASTQMLLSATPGPEEGHAGKNVEATGGQRREVVLTPTAGAGVGID